MAQIIAEMTNTLFSVEYQENLHLLQSVSSPINTLIYDIYTLIEGIGLGRNIIEKITANIYSQLEYLAEKVI